MLKNEDDSWCDDQGKSVVKAKEEIEKSTHRGCERSGRFFEKTFGATKRP